MHHKEMYERLLEISANIYPGVGLSSDDVASANIDLSMIFEAVSTNQLTNQSTSLRNLAGERC